MNFELQSLDLAQAASSAADVLVLPWPDGAKVPAVKSGGPLAQLLARALDAGDWETGVGKVWSTRLVDGVKARQVVLVRAGDGSPAQLRRALAAAWAGLRQPAIGKALLWLGAVSATRAAVRVAMGATADATYVYTATLSKPKARTLQRVILGMPDAALAREAFRQGEALVHGVETAREWANRPGNHATPTLLAEAARKLSKTGPVKVEVLGPRQVQALGMGAFLAVAQGSEEPLRFIVLRYEGAPKSQAPVVLVGKGITFDTGGISLKPASEMDEMKFDMGGAASVLGVFAALARHKPAVNVIGLIPSCENMPDGRAVKPGDVVTSMSGQTIEILNTDAEGRLILCDALTYAQRFKPRALIDIATLTGACVIALGGVRSGLFSNHDALAQALAEAGELALDPCWRMPLDDDYAEGLKTSFADVANVAGRAGGSVTAAKFLQRFVGDAAWAHLDIAGTAWKSGAAKGATGRPVALLMQYLWDLAAQAATSPRVAKSRPAGKGKS